MNIVLVGYRACGKSTVGKLLAEKLKIPSLDTDLLVEENAGMPIREIIAGRGWDYFRAREKEVVQKLAQKDECVIATGGGVVLDEDNISALKKTGFIIWLNTPFTDIVERLMEDAETSALRPQFTDCNLTDETVNILNKRVPLYRKAADLVVDTAGKSAVQVMESIYQCLLGIRYSGKKSNESINKTVLSI